MHKLDLNNLTLSEKKMDNTLALEYIKTKGSLVLPADSDDEGKPQYMLISLSKINGLSNTTGRRLAKEIEDNTEMFVQLEHLSRGTEAQDVRNGHIKLMSQILQCSEALWNHNLEDHYVVVNENTPLYMLGAIARTIYRKNSNLINVLVAHPKMNYLCLFFFELCSKFGLCHENFATFYSKPILNHHSELKMPEDPTGGCTGVVAEWSDMESALEAFIDSSMTAPWGLRQIYVQESVFEDFKKAIASRTNIDNSNLLVIAKKMFAIEALETISDQHIPVHAYRTTKDLISLINTPYVSVWAANSAESNEIALKTKSAKLVWINEYGTFDGRPWSAVPLYGLYIEESFGHAPSGDFVKRCENWSKLRPEDRFEIITNALADYEQYASVLRNLIKWRSDDFLHVTDKTICFGVQVQVQVPAGVIVMLEKFDDILIDICKVLINGNFVLTGTEVPVLANAGIPIEPVCSKIDAVTKIKNPMLLETLKVVRTNYGTIFAN